MLLPKAPLVGVAGADAKEHADGLEDGDNKWLPLPSAVMDALARVEELAEGQDVPISPLNDAQAVAVAHVPL